MSTVLKNILKYMDYEYLYEQYYKLNKSAKQIAIENNCSEGTILSWLNKNKIPMKRN